MGLYTRVLKRLGHRRWMAAFGRRMVPADRWVQRRTGGRVAMMGRGFDALLLTTTGRQSGQPRVSPLVYARVDGGFVVAGTNFGQPHHPAWTANLLAHPDATVSVGGESAAGRARLVADGPERERLWRAMTAVWPAYDTYAARAGRPIRLFLLSPGEAAADAPKAQGSDVT